MAKKTFSFNALHKIALVLLFAGAAGSVGLMLRTGHNNKSVLLLALFTGWVLSPFIGLLVAGRPSGRWSLFMRSTYYIILVLVLTLGSLIGYSGILSPPGTKPAFVFLFIPLVSWILIAIVILVATTDSRRSKVNR